MDDELNIHSGMSLAGGSDTTNDSTVLWFRRGLRFHDNPSLLEALSGNNIFYPIFIYDGESAVITKDVGYNRLRFLLESLADLDRQLNLVGGKLHFVCGDPKVVFKALHRLINLRKVCFEQDVEPIWQARDLGVKTLLNELHIEWIEKISHTLWNPLEIIETNGGTPPLTYQMFLHTVSVIGAPPKPVADPVWGGVKFGFLPLNLADGLKVFRSIPTPEDLGILPEPGLFGERMIRWIGGETEALSKLEDRIQVEENAFLNGFYLPNQVRPNLLGPPNSQSAALCFGCLSVRKFYWAIHDKFNRIHNGSPPSSQHITGQLIWREYFYTMSSINPYYGEMVQNPICLNIPWQKEEDLIVKKWENGLTGFPFIDAVMRQLHQEGWVHHVARNAVACFLTRGGLWLSWEIGLRLFLRLLLDADWSVCAGNWMWVSSSAFEQVLDCGACICPVSYGRRLDPEGEYIKRYIPELRNYPEEYLYEPWKAPVEVQKNAGCLIGEHYPERIIDYQSTSIRNRKMMESIRNSLLTDMIPHCCPSSEEEARSFMWLPETCSNHLCV